MLLDIDKIVVGDRLRVEYGTQEFEELCQSIAWMGLLQNIVVESMDGNGTYKLVAGEHRLLAVKRLNAEGKEIPHLPAGQIRAEIQGELSAETSLIIEVEENIRRKDLSYIEKAKYVRRFHEIFTSRTPKWTAEMTAAALRLSPASISHYLRVEEAVKTNPEVAKASTLDAAVKRMKASEQLERKKKEVAFKATLGDQGVQRAKDALTHGDAREWIKKIPDNSVDLVNFDPPYGEEVSRKSAENWHEFDDSVETSDELMKELLPELHRVLKQDSFCIFWYRQWYYKEALELALSFGFSAKFTRTPCIWHKIDKVSDQMRFPEKQLIDAYETFFLLRKGDPVFNEREIQNVFTEPRTMRGSLIHPTEKPLRLMERLIKLCCVPGAVVLDPCAGSGSTLHAAWANHRKPLGCELDSQYYNSALARLSEVMK